MCAISHGIGVRATHTSSGLLFVSEATIESDGKDAFVVYNGVRIAKRGQPNSPEAGTWVSLEADLNAGADRVLDFGQIGDGGVTIDMRLQDNAAIAGR